MAIVQFMFVPSSVLDTCLKIGADTIQLPVSLLPITDNTYSLLINGAGNLSLVFDHDDTAPAPSGVFVLASTGESYNLSSTPYITP